MAIVDVVKYDGGPDVFAWKYPSDELGTWTQLIVNETQEALLFKGGQALDLFGPGRHTLSTANIPLLNKLINLPFGGKSPFKAEVWYINKIVSLDVKWGTATPIQLQDPKYQVFVPVRSFGQFGIRIDDSRRFILKLVGTMTSFDKTAMINYFRGLYLMKVKDSISAYLVHKGISVLEINAYLEELSTYLQEKMAPVFAEYGIQLVNFYVNDINVPEDDTAVVQLKAALAKRAEMNIIGYNYVQERSFDTLEGAATNPGSTASGLMGAGIGLGMGVGMGGAVGTQFGGVAGAMNIAGTVPCPKCGAQVSNGKRFCSECGADMQRGEKPSKSDKVRCSKCGFLYPRDTKFCPECGDKYNSCPSCGADMPEDADVCPECGKKRPTPCPKCGKPLKDNAKFCPECGASLSKACGKCGAALESGTKFCPECGEPQA